MNRELNEDLETIFWALSGYIQDSAGKQEARHIDEAWTRLKIFIEDATGGQAPRGKL